MSLANFFQVTHFYFVLLNHFVRPTIRIAAYCKPRRVFGININLRIKLCYKLVRDALVFEGTHKTA